ncbi:MAG TPA: NAD(P)-dependent alcohol dehydrogenase [Terracidiphilus sp.]|nr:NAD(P)-dependent alcohol dehydrogenase [Terracidiphilus sp.]
MSQIQGFAVHAAGAELVPFRYDPGELGPHEVEIAVSHCGICHSDLHLISNDWGISQYPFIPGHEIIGTVTAVGAEVRGLEEGRRVGLGWQSNSCGRCEWCMKGMENLCPESEGTCVRRNGGYADRVRADSRFVIPVPDELESEQAAPLLCGGITVYTPMRKHGINPSSRVGVVGIGGLGHLAIQFARVFGAEVTAFSTSAAKEDEARKLGALRFVNTRESKAMKEVAGTQDFILSTINADQEWASYMQALRPTGTLCFVGVPPSPVAVQAFPLISGARSITGSPIGSPHQLREMMDVAARHGVKAQTERFAMSKANEAIEKVKKNKVRYRAVLAN